MIALQVKKVNKYLYSERNNRYNPLTDAFITFFTCSTTRPYFRSFIEVIYYLIAIKLIISTQRCEIACNSL